MNDFYEQKAQKYKYKYLKLKELEGGLYGDYEDFRYKMNECLRKKLPNQSFYYASLNPQKNGYTYQDSKGEYNLSHIKTALEDGKVHRPSGEYKVKDEGNGRFTNTPYTLQLPTPIPAPSMQQTHSIQAPSIHLMQQTHSIQAPSMHLMQQTQQPMHTQAPSMQMQQAQPAQSILGVPVLYDQAHTIRLGPREIERQMHSALSMQPTMYAQAPTIYAQAQAPSMQPVPSMSMSMPPGRGVKWDPGVFNHRSIYGTDGRNFMSQIPGAMPGAMPGHGQFSQGPMLGYGQFSQDPIHGFSQNGGSGLSSTSSEDFLAE